MSNRGRQIVASYLVKNLQLDWRLGAAWFESTLIDLDVASNYGNWAYQAGVGNDPQKDRVFNLKIQTEKYDPNNQFIGFWNKEIP
jgi:deoxyribodipyrimidine photo-lyase